MNTEIEIKIMQENIEKYKILTKDKHFSYKVKMAVVLLSAKEAYEILKEDNKKEILKEGVPSAIWQRILKEEIYETKAWYIPDNLKIWDRRFGQLFKYPFFAFDDDIEAWSEILEFYIKFSTPQIGDYPNQKAYNSDWQFFAELVAVAEKNAHPLAQKAYETLKNKGLPEKVLEKKRIELERYSKLEFKERGIEHFSKITNW